MPIQRNHYCKYLYAYTNQKKKQNKKKYTKIIVRMHTRIKCASKTIVRKICHFDEPRANVKAINKRKCTRKLFKISKTVH